MQGGIIAAIVFLIGLVISAWLAARSWDTGRALRWLPIGFGLAFGFSYSAVFLDNGLWAACKHALMASAIGAVIVAGLWVEIGWGGRTRRVGPGQGRAPDGRASMPSAESPRDEDRAP
jgi:hypothetical protein